jgi:sulfite exporter TauE/SafE
LYLLAAISLGFLGSFHCVGMCGPIALSLPVSSTSRLKRFYGSLLYNSGRLITYSLAGFLFGIFGRAFAIAGWQHFLSVSLGMLILCLIFIPKISFLRKNTGTAFLYIEKMKSGLKRLFHSQQVFSLLLIGILNGLLPCGLVYLGITGAISTANGIHGALFMFAFGLGTFPAMLLLSFTRSYITMPVRNMMRRIVPVFAGTMALLLIIRGLDLGIPYLSPYLHFTNGGDIPYCGH